MSISSKIEELAFDKAAIKAAIDAKLPSVPVTDSLSQWPTSIMSIPQTRREACWPGGPDIPEWKNDGDTWFWVDLSRCLPGYERKVAFQFTCNYVGGMTVDWGDGTTSTNTVGSSYVDERIEHTYDQSLGNRFQIKLTTTYNYSSLGLAYTTAWNAFIESRPIYAVEFGTKTNINQYHGGSGGLWNSIGIFSSRNKTIVFFGDNRTAQGIAGCGVESVTFGNGAKISTYQNSMKLCNFDLMREFDTSVMDTSSTTTFESLFSGSMFSFLDLSNLALTNVTSMRNMFTGCTTLFEVIGLDRWNVENVTDMYRMFYTCNALVSMDGMKNWDVGKVTTMYQMFYQCTSLKDVDISNWNLESVTFEQMFMGCSSLTSVKMPNVSTVYHAAFWDCKACTLYDFRKCTSVPVLSTVQVFQNINANAYIVVPDDLYSTWRESSNWSNSSIQPHIISVTDYEAL